MKKNQMMVFFLLFFMSSNGHSNSERIPTKYTELLEYIVRSPNQSHTDNCLFMAVTGAVEIVASKYKKLVNPEIDGPTDFNEKTALYGDLEKEVSWFEDPALRFNSGALKNDDFPYSGKAFWNGRFPTDDLVKVPEIKTNWFLTSENGEKSGRFSYDEFKDKDLTKIKEMLIKYRSPIVIIYRTAGRNSGYGYWNTWHTAVIVGYDDQIALEEACPLVKETIEHIRGVASSELRQAVARQGGCHRKGGFYVRDSEDLEPGETRIASHRVVAYDDIKILGTNAMVVYSPTFVQD